MKSTILFAAFLACGFCACSSDAPPPPETAAQTPKPLPKSNVFSSDVNALNKAKNVQNIVNQQKQKTDAAINDDGG
ncbi:MAG TPA: hypothetical protein VFN13_10685 [Rudaea sp.]|nr:hypothetical protein [Rudaea sp.]